MCCEQCVEAHAQIKDKLDNLERIFEVHQAEVHGTLVNSDVIQKWDRATIVKVEKLADAILGPQQRDFDGSLHRLEAEGLISKVEANTKLLQSIDHQVHNGMKFKLRTSDKVLVALIGAAVAIVQVIWG